MKKKISAILFDFDGVIAESVDVKTKAFRELFKNYPDRISEIENFHLENGGISRYIKFKYIYTNILKKKLTRKKFESLGRNFKRIVIKKVIKAPLVKGAVALLEHCNGKYPIYVISGTPEDEMRKIIKNRHLGKYFLGVYGSPHTKVELIKYIFKKGNFNPSEVIFAGDSKNDYEAAKKTGVRFAFRKMSYGQGWSKGKRMDMVFRDLTDLGAYIKKLEKYNKSKYEDA